MDPLTMALIAKGVGTGLDIYGKYKSGKAKKESAKTQMEQLMQALAQFKAGSEDMLGNRLSADSSGKWKFTLTDPTKHAVNNVNKAMYLADTTANKTSGEIMRDNLLGNHLANTLTARANQQAAMRSGARTNSNLGKISKAYGQQGSQNLRDMYQQGVKAGKNATMYNAQLRNALNNNIITAQQPINSIQNNLRGMVHGLNGSVMNQYNQLATSSSNPYLHGQAQADFYQDLGGLFTDAGQNMEQKQKYDDYMDILSKYFK